MVLELDLTQLNQLDSQSAGNYGVKQSMNTDSGQGEVESEPSSISCLITERVCSSLAMEITSATVNGVVTYLEPCIEFRFTLEFRLCHYGYRL